MTGSTGAGKRRSYLSLVALTAAAAALLVAPAAGQAAFKFGSKLTPETQPSNAGDGQYCDMNNLGAPCTWVMNEAYGRPNGGHLAPRVGRIKWLRVIANVPGSFQLFLVRARPDGSDWEGKAVRKGRRVVVKGQPDPDAETYVVEKFKMNLLVRKGERLAIRTNRTSAVRCSSGGDNTLLFKPPLAVGNPFLQNFSDDGCWLLVEAVAVKPPKKKKKK